MSSQLNVTWQTDMHKSDQNRHEYFDIKILHLVFSSARFICNLCIIVYTLNHVVTQLHCTKLSDSQVFIYYSRFSLSENILGKCLPFTQKILHYLLFLSLPRRILVTLFHNEPTTFFISKTISTSQFGNYHAIPNLVTFSAYIKNNVYLYIQDTNSDSKLIPCSTFREIMVGICKWHHQIFQISGFKLGLFTQWQIKYHLVYFV